MTWLMNNLSTIIVCIALVAVVVLIINKMIKDKKTSAEEVTKSMLDTIKAKESDINAFTNVFEESALLMCCYFFLSKP